MENLIEIKKIDRSILQILLMDRTTGKNIIWATDSYAHLGPAYKRDKQVFIDQIWDTGIIEPRIQKALEVQKERTKKNAEVFTPAWICNQMNNKVEIDWLSPDSTFNTEIVNGWETSKEQIKFRTKAGWKSYIRRRVLEITCGEAPFLVSRYDSSTGETIPVGERIGLLDRKLRIAAENTKTAEEWFSWVLSGLKKTYGYEFQGDSLLLGRINIFLTIQEFMNSFWNKRPELGQQKEIAKIISWNFFQMDGLTNCTPIGIPEDRYIQPTLFDFFKDSQQDDNIAAPIKIDWWDKSKRFQLRDMKEGKIMGKKFDVVIGNPPYQIEAPGTSTSDKPVYHLFWDEAKKIADTVELITPGRFLFNAGATPKAWNEMMLNDDHCRVEMFEQKSNLIFPGTDIKGGVAVVYRNDKMNFGKIGTYSPYQELSTILSKVNPKKGETIDTIVSGRGIYKLSDEALHEHPEVINIQSKGHKKDVGSGALKILNNIIYYQEPPKDQDKYVKVLGIVNGTRTYHWMKERYLDAPESFYKFKVFIPKANGSGAIGEVLSTPLVGAPLVGATESFLSIGEFRDELSANNCMKYIKTKFTRAMLGILKITQDNTREKWKCVPLQNFTTNSDIDWSKSIPEIDQQLYKKYNLSPEEINFIETHVKEME